MSETSSFKAFWPAAVWAAILVYLSATPGIDLPDVKLFEPDKLAHAGAYGLFTYLLLRGFRQRSGSPVSRRKALISFLIAAGWGALMELMQDRFFPYRYFEIADEIANIFGSILSVGIFKLFLDS